MPTITSSLPLRSSFKTNTDAVIDLPLRLVVSLIIGMISLAAILSFILQPGFIDPELNVTLSNSIIVTNESNVAHPIQVTVLNEIQHPIKQAQVIFKSNYFIDSNQTDENGKTILIVNTTDMQTTYETYVDVMVKASGYQPYERQNLIKIIYQ